MSIILTLLNVPEKRVELHNIIKKAENHSSIIESKNNISVKSYSNYNNTLSSARQVKHNSKISQN